MTGPAAGAMHTPRKRVAEKADFMKGPCIYRSRTSRRRGAALILILVMLAVILVMAAITIDFAYIQLVRTEMRSATDAAAKAGAEALSRTEDKQQAREAAVRYAALNTVGGLPLQIRESDVHIGRLQLSGGRWQFVEGGMPPNAVRVDGHTGGSALHPAVPLFLAGVHGRETFAPGYTATAGQQEVEVVLCLDRSGSMLFDMSGDEYVYPPGNPNLMPDAAWNAVKNRFPASQHAMWRNHLSAPHPANSRWAVLRDAITLFLDEAGMNAPQPRTSLVTWSSNYTMPCPPSTVFQASATNVNLPPAASHNWNANRAQVQAQVNQLGNVPMMGATNLSAGLDRSVSVLTGTGAASFSNKVVILLTDGEWNQGRSPIDAANDARAAGVIVHCVLMLTADQPDIRQVADITGGRYYVTQNEAELRTAFQELARSLPVVLTQ